jgi:hypothetical protein
MKIHPFLKAAALAALLVPLPVGAPQGDRAGNNPAAIAFLQQAFSWPQKTPADGFPAAPVAHVPGMDGIADIGDIASLTTLLKQVVDYLSAA